MSSFAANAQGKIKEVLRTAIIGIQPGDQVMLKGYLRVLLRLEVDLEWVAANGPNVDLFIINNQFRAAESVIKLLQNNPNKPVLYVVRGDDETGQVENNTIHLPLKKLHNLNRWLFDNVQVLNNNKAAHRQMVDDSELTLHNVQPNETLPPSTSTQSLVDDNTSLLQTKNINDKIALANEQGEVLLRFVKTLDLREDKYYELWVQDGFVGIVHPKRQYIWLSTNAAEKKYAPDHTWELRETQRVGTDKNKGQDLVHWLWLQALYNPQALLPLLSPTQEFQLCFWMKPPNDNSRRAVLRLLTALETQPRTLAALAQTAETNKEIASKTLAGLLFSCSLKPDIYKLLKADAEDYDRAISANVVPIKASAIAKSSSRSVDDILARRRAGEVAAPLPSSIDISAVGKATSSSPQSSTQANGTAPTEVAQDNKTKTKKRGFLAKLRDKLGL